MYKVQLVNQDGKVIYSFTFTTVDAAYREAEKNVSTDRGYSKNEERSWVITTATEILAEYDF
jgi:hypothetical protein